MDALQVLNSGRALIADEKNWTQGAFARTGPDGCGVSSVSTMATCWCSTGALSKMTYKLDDFEYDIIPISRAHHLAYSEAYHFLGQAVYEMSLGATTSPERFNDSHTHEEVLAAWDRAIQMVGG